MDPIINRVTRYLDRTAGRKDNIVMTESVTAPPAIDKNQISEEVVGYLRKSLEESKTDVEFSSLYEQFVDLYEEAKKMDLGQAATHHLAIATAHHHSDGERYAEDMKYHKNKLEKRIKAVHGPEALATVRAHTAAVKKARGIFVNHKGTAEQESHISELHKKLGATPKLDMHHIHKLASHYNASSEEREEKRYG